MLNIIENVAAEYSIDKIEKYVAYLNKELENEKLFSIVFMDNEEIHAINKEFRNMDKPTDVLSFEDFSDDYLGDILISIPRTKEQALEYGHSFEREILFLITHGFLHLNGYDHMTKEEEEEMFKLQYSLLNNYGVTRNG